MDNIKIIFLKFLLKIKTLVETFNERKQKKSIKTDVKASINSAAQLNFVSENEKIREEAEKTAEKIVMNFKNDTEKTIKFIKKKNVKVYRTKFAVKLLQNIGEKQGFIIPLKGFKAFYINFVFGLICEGKINISFKTPPLFVFNKNNVEPFYLAAQIYKWVAHKKNMPGFEFEVQEKFKKLYNKMTEKEINKLTAEEIFAIKETLARENEAADFGLRLYSEQRIKTEE